MDNNTNRRIHPFAGARKAKPTKDHRPAIWESLLGTVEARSPEGITRYFDYDWEAARAFAGIDESTSDLRLARYPRIDSGPIRYGQWVLYTRR